jgi:hypothetical protein
MKSAYTANAYRDLLRLRSRLAISELASDLVLYLQQARGLVKRDIHFLFDKTMCPYDVSYRNSHFPDFD